MVLTARIRHRCRSLPKGSGTGDRARAARHERIRLRPAVFMTDSAGRPPSSTPDEKNRISHRGRRRSPALLELLRDPGRAIERPGVVRFAALPPLALYVHIPWCVRKCPYCDFNSHERARRVARGGIHRRAAAPTSKQRCRRSGAGGSSSVFIGGGTPSLFAPESIDALLAGVRARLTLERRGRDHAGGEPRHGRGGALRGLSRTRASIASPSACRASTTRMLRRSAASTTAARRARAVDAALAQLRQRQPRPDVRAARAERRRWRAPTSSEAIALRRRISRAYQLTLEPNTRVLHAIRRALPDARRCAADMQIAVEERSRAAGYEHYETSAFARPGPLPPQPQLLAVRRLPRHRRRRARQAQLPRPRHAPVRWRAKQPT